MHEAAFFGNDMVIKVLLKNGMDAPDAINAQDNERMTALHLAALHGRNRVIQMLIDEAQILIKNAAKETPLITAAAEQQIVALKLLIPASQSCINDADISGHTAIYYALEGPAEDEILLQLLAQVPKEEL